MSKAKTNKPAGLHEEQPTMGGSYTRDPVTGKLTREHYTRDIRDVPAEEPVEKDEEGAAPPPADPAPPAAPEEKEA